MKKIFVAFAFQDADRPIASHIDRLVASHNVKCVNGERLGGNAVTPAVLKLIEDDQGADTPSLEHLLRQVEHLGQSLLLSLLSRLFLRLVFSDELRIEGGERLPEQGPVVVVCNHLSNLDPLIFGGFSTRATSRKTATGRVR